MLDKVVSVPSPNLYSWKSVSEMGPTIHVMRRWASVGNSGQCGLPTGQSTHPNHLETLPSSSEAGCLVAQARPLTGAERLQGAVLHLRCVACTFEYTFKFVSHFRNGKSAFQRRSAQSSGVQGQPTLRFSSLHT